MASEIQCGYLLPEPTKKADGTHGAFLGTIVLKDNTTHPVFIKCNNIHKVTIELFASKLIESIGLKTPTPYLVFCPEELIPSESVNVLLRENVSWIEVNDKKLFPGFACEEVSLPSVNQKVGSELTMSIAKTFVDLFTKNCPGYTDVIGFDEWIANGDRNLGNILWDGQKEFYLIDHGLAMNEAYFNAFGNKLLSLIVLASNPSSQKSNFIFKKSLSFIETLQNQIIDSAASNLLNLNHPDISKNVLLLSEMLKRRIKESQISLALKKSSMFTKELFVQPSN